MILLKSITIHIQCYCVFLGHHVNVKCSGHKAWNEQWKINIAIVYGRGLRGG